MTIIIEGFTVREKWGRDTVVSSHTSLRSQAEVKLRPVTNMESSQQ